MKTLINETFISGTAEPAENVKLSLTTLGNFGMAINGIHQDPSDIMKRKKVQDLLILLIINRKEGLGKNIIFDTFWENYTYKSKKDNLNTLIYRLKKLFITDRELLFIDRNTIRLNMEHIEVDIDTFLEKSESAETLEKEGETGGSLEAAQAALELYRGDFFENANTDIPLEKERSKFREIYLSLLFRTLKLSILHGHYMAALETGKQLLKNDPFCEPAYRLVMNTLGYIGNTSEITRLYRELKQKLHTAFQIAPDDKTTALINKLSLGVPPEREDILKEVSFFL